MDNLDVRIRKYFEEGTEQPINLTTKMVRVVEARPTDDGEIEVLGVVFMYLKEDDDQFKIM